MRADVGIAFHEQEFPAIQGRRKTMETTCIHRGYDEFTLRLTHAWSKPHIDEISNYKIINYISKRQLPGHPQPPGSCYF